LPKKNVHKPDEARVTVIAVKLMMAVIVATVTTATYLAIRIPKRGTGAAMSDSKVPRSRSPAVKSIAG
jgi:hypothetical protein